MFTTRAITGVPTVLSGSPVVSAYENDSAVQITAGITLGVDHDTVSGLNLLTIVATGANGYETGKDYNMVITTGTVNSVSAVGEVVGTFSIGRSAAFTDLENGTDGLSALLAACATATGFATPTNITAGTLTTVTNLTNLPAITANWLTATGIASNAFTAAKFAAASLNGKGDWNIGKTGYALTTAGILAIWHQLESAVVTASTMGLKIKTNLDALISSRASPTNITAGTITTVTNLTNAPTSGDLTATMKTSVTTAATAATPIAASVTGAVGSVTGLTASNLDATVSSRMATTHLNATAGKLDGVALVDTTTTNTDMVAAAPSAVAIADQVWDEAIVGHAVVGSTGEALSAAGSAGDPWVTALPGAYGAGTAGEILGDWKNAGRLDEILDTIAKDTTTDIPGLIINLHNLSPAVILTQINTALDTAIAELVVGVPSVTPSLRTGLMLLYMALRNKIDVQTSGTDSLQIHNDAGTKITEKLLTDDGTDYSEAKMI